MVEVKTRYVVVSQDIPIAYYDNKNEAIEYVKTKNKEWLKYKQECLDNYEPYADNECFLYEEIQYDNGYVDRIEIDCYK